MLVESILSNNPVLFLEELQERLKQIIDKRLAEKRFDIIQKEFGFLNEGVVDLQKVATVRKFAKNLNKDPNTRKKPTRLPNKPEGYKRLGTKLVGMSSLEKFHRKASKHKSTVNLTKHIKVAVRKRQQTNQKKKVLGLDTNQKPEVLGFKNGRTH